MQENYFGLNREIGPAGGAAGPSFMPDGLRECTCHAIGMRDAECPRHYPVRDSFPPHPRRDAGR